MDDGLEFALRAALIGVGATAFLDLWSACLKRFFGVPPPNYELVGRWIGYFPEGRFVHDSIARATPVRGEQIIGWSAHYAIGILFAALLLAIWGLGWSHSPTLLPALTVGLLSVAAPFLVMQPGMGAGIAASRTPKPNLARLRSITVHAVFGLGLYLAALLSARLILA